MASHVRIKVNGLIHGVSASLDTPLLYVLHNELHLHGPRFGCGLAQCGACTVHLDGSAIRSCATPVSSARGAKVTTLEGLAPGEKKPGGALQPVRRSARAVPLGRDAVLRLVRRTRDRLAVRELRARAVPHGDGGRGPHGRRARTRAPGRAGRRRRR